MSTTPPLRASGVKAKLAFVLASTLCVLAVAALLVALVVDPPALGWVGFAITSAVVIGLAAAATLLLPRLRVSPAWPAVPADAARRLLAIVDAYCSEEELCDEIEARLDGPVAVHVVVPVRLSHLHFLANDDARERRFADESVRVVVGLLRRRGISATGGVGSDKPLESMADALAAFPASEVLLATPAEEPYWLERDLLAKAQGLTKVPVTSVVVPTSRRAPSALASLRPRQVG